MMRRARLLLSVAASTMALASCQAFVDTEPGAGIGAACRKDTDCQASACFDGVCAIECAPGSNECPAGTFCSDAALCQLPMRVAALYPGPGGKAQDWALAHDLGFQRAADQLPYLTEVLPISNVGDAADAAAQAAAAVGQGFNAIFAASPDWNTAIRDLAAQNPAVQFFTVGGGGGPGNHHGYYGRLYKAWYLAGAAAASVEAGGRLGIVGSFVTPSVVRHINAFVRGARSVDPTIVAEVQWMHEWVSTPGNPSDVELAASLVDNGATVVTYHGYNRFAGTQALADGAWVVANNLLRNGEDELWCTAERCLGTVYWNWAPLYRRLIDEAHSASLGPGAAANDDIGEDPASSVPNFDLRRPELADANDILLKSLVGNGVGVPFQGPFCFTDGSCVEEGQTLNDGDLGAMCRFVEGVVTHVGPGTDEPALVPNEADCQFDEE